MGLGKKVLVGGLMVGSFFLGKGCSGSDESGFVGDYQLRMQEGKVQVYDRQTEQAHDLNRINDQYFLGGGRHNSLGALLLYDQK